MNWCETGEMIEGKDEVLRHKSVPVTLFSTNPTWAKLEYCSDLCRYMPANNHLSQGRALILFGLR